MPFKVPYVDLPAQYLSIERELNETFRRVMSNASFILRDDVRQLEQSLASYLGVQHVVGVNSGTDAIYLALHAAGLKPGDEVITVGHTFVATIASIVHNRFLPVLVDIADDFNMDLDRFEAAITSKTRAVIPVHLNGRLCDTEKIAAIARKHKLVVIDDAAQSLGASLNGKMPGVYSWAACFSLHPMKNLGGAGDGGFVATNDANLAEQIQLLRNHGQATKEDVRCFGFNSRLDNLQAALLNVKFKYLPQWIDHRRRAAQMYHDGLQALSWLKLPPPPEKSGHYDVYSSYVVCTEKRDALMRHLREHGIEVFAHWNPSNHLQKGLALDRFKLPKTEQISREVVSLPINAEISDDQVTWVIEAVKKFKG